MSHNAWIEEVNYMNDPRVRARDLWKNFNEKENLITRRVYFEHVIHHDPGGDWDKSLYAILEDEGVKFPAKFAVCDLCEGKGSHVNPGIDASGISPHEFYEDPDFAEDYFSGNYNVPCNQCQGKRVIPVVDESLLSLEEVKIPICTYNGKETGDVFTISLEELWKHELKMEEDRYLYERESLAERRMGA